MERSYSTPQEKLELKLKLNEMKDNLDLGDSIHEWILMAEGEGRELSEPSPYEIEEPIKEEFREYIKMKLHGRQ